MATGILWTVIIGLWAAYLVPLWIARHDTSRLHAQPGPDEVDQGVASGDDGDGAAAVRSGDALFSRAGRDGSSPRRRRGAGVAGLFARRRAHPVARRRRTLLGLVVTLIVILVAVPLGPMPGWATAPAAIVLGCYLVHLRHQARRVELSRRHHSPDRRPDAPTQPQPTPTPTPPRRGHGGRARRPAGAGRRADAQQPTDEEPPPAPTKPSPWQPLPVPLPTYVTNPGAIHPARAVELTRAAAWSSARFGSDVALRWHAAPTGPALSLGPDVASATSPAQTQAPTPDVQPAATSATSWPMHEPEVRQAVGG